MPDNELMAAHLQRELDTIWQAHARVGLKGKMSLFSLASQTPWRSSEPGHLFWFGPDETAQAVQEILRLYKGGKLPNTTLLLNPIVHEQRGDAWVALGSGIAWCTSLALGKHAFSAQALDRLRPLGLQAELFTRGEDRKAGLKIVAWSDRLLKPDAGQPQWVEGCRELYELANMDSAEYESCYLLSGLTYLGTHGLFVHENTETFTTLQEPISITKIKEAAECWNAYERIHSLYMKFGTNPADIAQNTRFFELVARDVQLFDATGPMRKDRSDTLDFLVPGWIPRGAVTVIGAAGGVGKSSLAHYLACLVATDYTPEDPVPTWLGQPVAHEKCKGIAVYFSGEDGAPILNARASLFDPQRRAKRLLLQRSFTDEGITFDQFVRKLHALPDVPLMVVDPARKYLLGDEEDAGVVSKFFEAIEEFAIEKNAAVVVVHHLRKSAQPKACSEILDLLRGSQVFIDRPRVVIGMFRDGPYTIAGLAKNNIPPNMGMVQGERVFARNPKTLQLLWLPGNEGVRDPSLTADELESLQAIVAEERGQEQ